MSCDDNKATRPKPTEPIKRKDKDDVCYRASKQTTKSTMNIQWYWKPFNSQPNDSLARLQDTYSFIFFIIIFFIIFFFFDSCEHLSCRQPTLPALMRLCCYRPASRRTSDRSGVVVFCPPAEKIRAARSRGHLESMIIDRHVDLKYTNRF